MCGTFAQAQTVVDIIVDSPDHNTLEIAVIEAELVDALSGAEPFTVFALTDDAFAAIDTATLNALLADPTGDLQKILRYHIVNDSISNGGTTKQRSKRTVDQCRQ